MDIDYEKLGLICGIEIHQRLNTKRKLFCSCSPNFNPEDESLRIIERKLRSVPGELGDVDPAAIYEYYKDKLFEYHIFEGKTCLVELDEEPPHPLNQEALEIALTIAVMLNMYIPNEIECMRKTVVDGSNTSGFQRTMNVGIGTDNSIIQTSFGPVRIKDLELEEESAGIIEKKVAGRMIFRLDRLGIPLIEIGTHADIRHPDQAREVAEILGMICRMTGKVQRGLGTIRQDVNISIKGGSRIEVKGLQDLRMVSKLVENEVIRQKNLLKIKSELIENGISEFNLKIDDFTNYFSKSESKIIKPVLKYRGKILGSVIPKFSGYLKRILFEQKTLAKEIVDYSKAYGVKGFIHSDENLENYKLLKEFQAIRENLKLNDDNLILIMAGKEDEIATALNAVIERIKYLLIGIPEETRLAQNDGTTNYLRPLPGSARMYPETDIPPAIITDNFLKKIKENLPELPDEKKNRFVKKSKLSESLADQIIKSHQLYLFEEIIKEFQTIKPTLVANAIITLPNEIKKKYKELDPNKIKDEYFIEIFKLISQDKIFPDNLIDILTEMLKNPTKSAEKIAKEKGILKDSIDLSEIEGLIGKIVMERKEFILQQGEDRASKSLMGLIMKELKGKGSGKIINEILRKKIKEIMK
ncbi:MAG: Glu-tRNA(Gln) amidotransferase GatDE subunit E [Candidatus Lokiarchaeota archaeon]|nr:Glu-tRNA(Gln) amidotransferase GatDE subunit E [Candidatus Lokiarchaeota archaeon]